MSVLVGAVLCAGLLTSTGGCRSMGKKKIVPESLATCRELAQNGVTAMELGEWEKARTVLDEAVTTSPTDAEARRLLAQTLWQTHSRREAVVHMEAAVQLDPRHAPTVVRAGEMLLEIGVVDRAEQRAEQAIALDSTLAGGWALRGRVERQRGNSKRALADLQQALRFAPHQTDVLLQVAEVQYELGRPQRSLSTLHRLLDVYPPGEEPQQALWLEGLAYGAMERHQDAVESLAAASQRANPPTNLLYQLARAEQSAGQTASAANTARRVLAVDQQHEPSKLLLAQLQGIADPGKGDVIRR
ncbi:MAG: tetratricopeptide repeat protein [Planctomycetes bacterium]|nr:tetratricopeptide repeat protein [Planctomycetota bacterium]